MVTITRGGFSGHGGIGTSGAFRVKFERSGPDDPYEAMKEVGIAVRDSSVEAVVKTTEAIKHRVRDFIDAHFSGSAFTSNNRRRAANAIQSHYYDELADKGQYAGLVYSKLGRGSGPSSFVDYLLLHMRGGAVTPQHGEWLKIFSAEVDQNLGGLARTGSFPEAGATVFFVPSKDGQKLYLFRRYGAKGPSTLARSNQLIATFVHQVIIPASLSGLEAIASDRPELFEGAFGRALDERGVTE